MTPRSTPRRAARLLLLLDASVERLFGSLVLVVAFALLGLLLAAGGVKLAGLGALRLTPRRFTLSTLFERDAEKYRNVALMMVEPC